ncbi:Signal peptide peptidase SppA (protease 4) [hydrothermal vent metagenome]|uniref:Signal peptide peptidase SppA (Protease 4) n=1 Tax=hydrothermal vent metagenome TaxID=652676 RepID=A0A3B0USF9_9ZZZZ
MNTNTNIAVQKSPLSKVIWFIPNILIKLANFTRHFLLLIILLIIVLLFIANEPIKLKNNTALIIAPKGNVVNQYSGTPADKFIRQMQGIDAPETQMRDLLKTIKEATFDERISVLVLSPDFLWGIGLADLKELEKAIDDFREQSKKPVIAIAESMTQNQYYFANLADEIILDPQGFMFFQGYGSYRNYFKDGLDKLGVDVHLFRVGEYKSAAEPFIRNNMSDEAKDSALHYMNDLWDTYLTGIASRRNLSNEDVADIIEQQAELLRDASGNIAQMYKAAGLIDQVKNLHFKNKYLAGLSAVAENKKGFRHIELKDYLTVLEQEAPVEKTSKIAVIVAEGTILNGEQDAGSIGGITTSALLREARLDKAVKAVVLRVNSGGGSVFASEQIRREVDAIKIAGKPVVVSMGNVAASGGYWISMTADKIYASDATITGSIGIFGMFMTYPKTLGKVGVYTDGVGTSSWAGAFRPDKELNEGLAELIQANIDYGYQQFITAVAVARGLEVDMVNTIARGRVWTAKQAKEFGLIDEIGGLDDAIADAALKANIGQEYTVTWIEPELTEMQKFFMSSLAQVSNTLDIGIISDEQQILQQLLSPIAASLKLILNAPVGQINQFSHCFCEVEL